MAFSWVWGIDFQRPDTDGVIDLNVLKAFDSMPIQIFKGH